MITHQNHKFIYNDIASLELPNGICINYDCEAMSQDNFELISPDGGFRLVIEFFNSDKNIKWDLEEWCYYEDHVVINPPQPIITPTGLVGYIATFSSGDDNYEECTLYISDTERCNFWLWHRTGKPYDKAHYERVKAELLDTLKLI